MELQFRQRLTGTETEIARHKIVFGSRGQRRLRTRRRRDERCDDEGESRDENLHADAP
jgi:hypothetical protein